MVSPGDPGAWAPLPAAGSGLGWFNQPRKGPICMYLNISSAPDGWLVGSLQVINKDCFISLDHCLMSCDIMKCLNL